MNTRPIIHAGTAFTLLGLVAITYQASDGPVRDPALTLGPPPVSVAISWILPLPPLPAGKVLLNGVLLVVVGIKKSS